MTTSFYAPPEAFRGGRVRLPDSEARHAARSLRKQPGEVIAVVDGVGGWHEVELHQVGKRQAEGRVLRTKREVGEPDYDLTIGMALLKNKNRFETFLEKAVELGVRRIVPLQTRRTEKEGIKRGRFERILVAAMKQCRRSRLVELADPRPVEEFLQERRADVGLVCRASAEKGIRDVLTNGDAAEKISILIGPEGGFAREEIRAAEDASFQPVSLGRRRLRAETAAIAAACSVMLAHEA